MAIALCPALSHVPHFCGHGNLRNIPEGTHLLLFRAKVHVLFGSFGRAEGARRHPFSGPGILIHALCFGVLVCATYSFQHFQTAIVETPFKAKNQGVVVATHSWSHPYLRFCAKKKMLESGSPIQPANLTISNTPSGDPRRASGASVKRPFL